MYRSPRRAPLVTTRWLSAVMLAVGLATLPLPAQAEPFSIYLVRHAEKQAYTSAAGGPGLTGCGLQRAQRLAEFLLDVPLAAVYSTDFRRTRETAAPVVDATALTLQIYPHDALEPFAAQLKKQGQNALVVGHSNTTGVLAGLLSGDPGAPFDESEYDRLYQVVVSETGASAYLYRLASDCGE